MSTESLLSLRTGLAGRYTIEREVGRGGMATVYMARDLRHGRQVAVKVLDPELGAILGAERFLAEINVTANLQHPNLLPLFDSGEIDGLLFYVMPFVDGESLRQRLDREKQLPVDEAVRIATSVANSLDYAHGRGVIHRDLKPENILLQAGQPVVADFGIALAVSKAGGARVTATGLSLGTPQYMSPEQATGDRAIDGRTDIYSLGAVTYEMLTGEPPHTGATAQAIVAKLMTEDVRPLTVVRRSVPAHVDRAVRRALEKLPADRFGTAREFAAALHDPSPTSNDLAATATSVTSPPRWQSKLAVTVALGGVIAGALGAWALLRGWAAGAPGHPEPRYYSIALPDSAPLSASRDYLGIGKLSIAISRDGGALVYVADTPAGQQLVLVPLDGRGVRVLPGTANGHLPTFSPDGRSIAFVVGDTLVMRVSLDGGTVTPVARTSYPVSLEWLGDNIYMSGTPTVAPASGGAARQFPNTPSWQAWTTLSRYGTTSNWLLAGGNNLFLIRSADGVQRPLVLPNDTANAGRGSRGGSRYILFARDSTLFAAGFDSARAKFLTAPVAVLSGVRVEQSHQSQRALADDGTLVWADGGYEGLGQFVWASPDGTVRDTVPVPPAEVESFALSPDGSRLAFSRYNSDGALEFAVADLERRIVDVIPLPLPVSPWNWVNRGQDLAVRTCAPTTRSPWGWCACRRRQRASIRPRPFLPIRATVSNAVATANR
jgi:serine/threonine-protein kinase